MNHPVPFMGGIADLKSEEALPELGQLKHKKEAMLTQAQLPLKTWHEEGATISLSDRFYRLWQL
jgi:hypothetical protein